MNNKTKIAFVLFLLIIILSAVFAGIYLSRPQYMPYHAAAAGKSWAELDVRLQALILGLMRDAGGGWLAASLALLFLLLIPFRQGAAWSRWAILIVGLALAVPTLYGTLLVKFKTPGSPPWFVPAVGIVLLIAGFSLSSGPKKKRKDDDLIVNFTRISGGRHD